MKSVASLIMVATVIACLLGCQSNSVNEKLFLQYGADNREIAEKLHRDPINSAIIAQSTIFPHHFTAHTATLNDLGKKDLNVLADHYVNDVMPVSTPVNIVSDVRVYFDYNKANLRSEAMPVLDVAIKALNENPDTDVLITGRADVRGTDEYNLNLGSNRANTVDAYMAARGIDSSRRQILSRGEMDALAPETDEDGMQEDRNAHFIVAEVHRYPIPLNVRQAGASDYLYKARRKSTLNYLAEKGVDTSLIQLADDFAGGEGLASEQVFLIVTLDTSESGESSSVNPISQSGSGSK